LYHCHKPKYISAIAIHSSTVKVILILGYKFSLSTVHIEDLYCFHYTSSTEDIPKPAGWNFFDLQSEYQRMRVPSDQWSLTLLNKDYEVCITYKKGATNARTEFLLPVSFLSIDKSDCNTCIPHITLQVPQMYEMYVVD
jgi:hypothetical protein